MRVGKVTARALLSGLVMDHLQIVPEVSPNRSGLLLRQAGSCRVLEEECGAGCMPLGSVCCEG